jgi:peptide chain release factor 2
LATSEGIFDVAGREKRIDELEKKTTQTGFWDRAEAAQSVLRELKLEKGWVESYGDVRRRQEDLQVLAELAHEEGDAEAESEVRQGLQELEEMLGALEIRSLFRDEADARAAILTIHPGAGGIDSQDWAEMLLRMYLRWADRRGFETEVVDQQPAEEAGIKSASVIIRGDWAYGYLKVERGVHRLVRISPFDAQKRRHTSFASVDVWAEADEQTEIEIVDSDLRWDTFRASGAGGQHVNKTDSAVRITHEPTGIVVTCQSERSQHRNRETALKILKSRLYTLAREEERKRRQEIESQKGENAWGNQIRSYILQPYTMVKDHRLKLENGNVQAVMDGDLDQFIEAALLQGVEGKVAQ